MSSVSLREPSEPARSAKAIRASFAMPLYVLSDADDPATEPHTWVPCPSSSTVLPSTVARYMANLSEPDRQGLTLVHFSAQPEIPVL